jgi:hypothetical protein
MKAALPPDVTVRLRLTVTESLLIPFSHWFEAKPRTNEKAKVLKASAGQAEPFPTSGGKAAPARTANVHDD